MNKNILINIIIPCYYSSSTIFKCFENLAEQTAKDSIHIYFINDCSPNTSDEYSSFLELFKDKLSITYLKTPYHMGPGGARQFGLDAISNEANYIMFIDDDDRLENPYVIEKYLNIIQKYNNIIGFITGKYITTKAQRVIKENFLFCSLTGSIFNYNIIKKFNLQFLPINYDEDTLFYMQYRFILNTFTNLKIIEDDTFLAYHHYIDNKNSLTQTMQQHLKKERSILNIIKNMLEFFNNFSFISLKELFINEMNNYYNILLNLENTKQLTDDEILSLKSCYNLIIKLIKYNKITYEDIIYYLPDQKNFIDFFNTNINKERG